MTDISLWQYFGILIVIQLISGAIIGCILLLISQFLKKQFAAMIVGGILLLFPLVLLYLVHNTGEDIILSKFINGNMTTGLKPIQSIFDFSVLASQGDWAVWLIWPIAGGVVLILSRWLYHYQV